MQIDEREKLLDKMNGEIIKRNRTLAKIPFTFLKLYYFKKRIQNKMNERDIFWKDLRERTRKEFPERFS